VPIDLNSASVRELTQLPGVSKDIAYRIVNHRKRHGFFTAWQELLEVKSFPAERLPEIRSRAVLHCPDGPDGCAPPRHLAKHLVRTEKKSEANTKALRSTRGSDRAKEAAGPRHH
jgi:hypothetical protein